MIKKYFILIAVLSFLFFLFDCGNNESEQPGGGAKMSPPTEKVENTPADIEGVWINKDYDSEGRSGRVEYKKTGEGKYTFVSYDSSDGSGNAYKGTVVISKQWEDSAGNQLVLSKVSLNQGLSWESLSKMSSDGNTLEVQPGAKEINPNGPQYSVYQRQE